jgi:diacylglycerol kinase (ATP)
MRFHFFCLIAVLLSGLFLNLNNRDMLVLVFAVTLVIAAEMFNTAIEAVVDMITESYNPVAKLVKDVAAGAVLICAANAIIATILIFFGQDKISEIQQRMGSNQPDVTRVVVVGIVSLAMIVVVSKLLSNTGTPWHGGIISGHSAIGFMLAMTIFFTAHNSVISFLAILLAILVAQSRVEAGVHSLQEVILGAVLAILLTSIVYWLMPRVGSYLRPKNAPAASAPARTSLLLPLRRPARVEGDYLIGQS